MSGIARSPSRRQLSLGAALIGAALLLAGCVVQPHHDAPAPETRPAQHARPGTTQSAPTRVYRWKRHPRDGVELAWDTEAGVYVVLGRPAVYWDGERYLRWSRVGWQVTARLDGVWVSVSADVVPAGLRARHTAQAKGGKPGPGPAKRRD
jgi:hypothetical protein